MVAIAITRVAIEMGGESCHDLAEYDISSIIREESECFIDTSYETILCTMKKP